VIPKRIIEKKGITNIAVTEFNESIVSMCRDITQKLAPGNSYNLQLILNHFNKKPYVFELNPRFSTTVTLTIIAGVDEIMMPLNFYLQGKNNCTVNTKFKEDIVLIRSIHEDYMNVSDYNRKRFKIIHV
jgi:carbamoylphosphate synthase large subunit